MKFSCEKYLLSSAISTTSKAAAPKSPIPALEGLLIEAGREVRMSGYDLKKGIYTSFLADVTETGSIVLGARILGEIVKSLPDDIVTVSSDAGNMTTISCGASVFRIMGSSSEDYPELPIVDYTNSISIKQGVLKKMISETVFSVSDNESRPVHTGALFDIEKGVLAMVAVDGYRLSLRREPIEGCDDSELSFVVPGTALQDLEKIALEPDEMVRITLGSKHISFTLRDTVLVSRRLEGEFLDYKRAIPQENKYDIKADRGELYKTIERVSLIVEDRVKNPIRLVFADDEIIINCVTALGRADDNCSVNGTGKDMEIGFNSRFMLDALKAAPSEKIVLGISTGVSPCVILPEDGSGSFVYMILPVRLKAGE